MRCFSQRFFSQRIQLSIWLISMGDWMEVAAVDGGKLEENYQERILSRLFDDVFPNFFSRLIDSFTQWIQCKDRCKGFSAIHSILPDWIHSMQGGWILGIRSMARRCLSVCVGTWLDSGDSLASTQCRWILVMHSMDSMQKISARFQCKGYQ